MLYVYIYNHFLGFNVYIFVDLVMRRVLTLVGDMSRYRSDSCYYCYCMQVSWYSESSILKGYKAETQQTFQCTLCFPRLVLI